MEKITVELKTINTIFPIVAKILIAGEIVGYICENKEETRKESPHSILLPNGECLGDFCCVEHAVKAVTRHHCGDGIYVSKKDLFADMGALGILLAASLLSDQEGKRPH